MDEGIFCRPGSGNGIAVSGEAGPWDPEILPLMVEIPRVMIRMKRAASGISPEIVHGYADGIPRSRENPLLIPFSGL
jgi:hypothetical protein